MNHYVEAIDALKRCEKNNPYTHVQLAYAYSELGSEQEARDEAAEVMRIAPQFSLKQLQSVILGNWQEADWQHYLAELRKAGLKQ